MYTIRSELPAVTLLPSGDQLHFNKFFSKLCWCPSITFTHRFCGAYGRISHMQNLQSTICKKIWAAIRTQLHACYHILMALKCHCNFTFVRVPYLYFIVNTACEDLIRCLRETDCCNLVFIWKCLNGPLWHISNSLAVPSLDPLTTSGGPLREGHHEFTNEECSAIFLICFPISTFRALRFYVMLGSCSFSYNIFFLIGESW